MIGKEKRYHLHRLEFPEEEMADFQYNGSPSLPKKFIFLDLGYVLLLLLQHQLLLEFRRKKSIETILQSS